MNVFLITFAVLFPFGWIIYGLIRLTAKAFGDESPRVTRVSYIITKWQHFTRYGFIQLLLLTILLLFCVAFFSSLIVRDVLPASDRLIPLVAVGGSLYGLNYITNFFEMDWQYWLITRNRTITLDPTDKSLTITIDNDDLRITADLVDEIEHHEPRSKSRGIVAGYSYLLFKLKDGQIVWLNFNSVYLSSALDHYFKNVPIQSVSHKIPWISEP